jgi:hypothetical protein
MKTLLIGLVFSAIAMVFASQAFASDVPDCPKVTLKHGVYACGDIETNS